MATQAMRNRERLYIKKISERTQEIKERFLYSQRTAVSDVAVAETMEHLPVREAKKLKYKPVDGGYRWGANWGTAWFRLRIRIPRHFQGETVRLLFDLGDSECLIFRNGEPVQGLCWSRKDYMLFEKARGGERLELFVEAGANARLGAFDIRLMQQPEIAVLNREVWDAYWDLSALLDYIDADTHYNWLGRPYQPLNEDDPFRARIAYAMNEAVDMLDYRDPDRDALREWAKKARKRLRGVYRCKTVDSAQTFAAIGHAHIDVAWKWPLAETIRKCGRSFSNVLELMDRYKGFVFAQSQPQLYDYTKKRYPRLYERIRERIREGRWIPTGCMWVEPDCNLTGGESFVRQILHGRRFFEDEFGYSEPVLWLPDVFGFSPVLPQILKQCGIEYFFSTKISIGQFTRFPYHTFYWEGIDGSRVLTHFMPAEEYNAEVLPWEIRTGERAYAEKDRSTIQILPFGHGDGGGGPACEHVERLKRYDGWEGVPALKSISPLEFFERLESESENLPRWVGEIYLELHRGTYTTQALTKKNNRQGEIRLREAELLASIGGFLGMSYPKKRLDEAWKLLLLNQFHDILPGSSIDEVYIDSDRQFEEIFAAADDIVERSFQKLARNIDTRGEGTPVVAFNSLSWERKGPIEARVKALKKKASYVAEDADGATSPVQVCSDGLVRFEATLPPMGHGVFHIRKSNDSFPAVRADEKGMENDRLRVRFDRHGLVRRIFDKRFRRDVLKPGESGNRFVLYEDKMASTGSAWDVDIFYLDKPLETGGVVRSVEVVEVGPVRSAVRFTRTIGASTIEQDVILTAGSPRLDFKTRVHWGDEKDVMLKVGFPVNVRSEKARYDIQFGSIERPTHWNTPYDFARFEVPAHKWADLSEGNYGVALLNDCKYGYDVRDNLMRLTLLRAPKNPGENADVNKTHDFTYAILPHEGDFTSGVVRHGYELNVPAQAQTVTAHTGKTPPYASTMSVTGDHVIIEAVKHAEDGDAVIVRLYEAHGWRGTCTFQTTLPIERVVETDLLERELRELKFDDGEAALDLSPFEIRTLKLMPKKS